MELEKLGNPDLFYTNRNKVPLYLKYSRILNPGLYVYMYSANLLFYSHIMKGAVSD